MSNNADKAREKRYIKKYNKTLAEYNAMFAKQKGVCKICGKPPTGRPLHIEHDHKLRYIKIRTTKLQNGWLAEAADAKYGVVITRKTKSEAIQAVRREMLSQSVRGLVCWACNSMLKWGSDNPDILRKGAEYLEDYRNKFKQGGP